MTKGMLVGVGFLAYVMHIAAIASRHWLISSEEPIEVGLFKVCVDNTCHSVSENSCGLERLPCKELQATAAFVMLSMLFYVATLTEIGIHSKQTLFGSCKYSRYEESRVILLIFPLL